MQSEGHDEESAQNICGALQAEEKSEHGNVDQLREALERGAGLIADVGVDLVSGVDVPAVDSKWVMTKDADGHDWRANSPILLSKADGEEQRISYAAAMIPREPDKEGDVVATPTVENAAHDFLKQSGGVDTDHSLIDGEGEVVESWVLKDERTFDLPGGETETYGPGTWMVGIEWGQEAWSRIKSGELTGLSIYGMAEHVPLERSACGCPTTATAKQLDIPLANESVVHLVYESRTAAEKASEEIGLDGAVHEHEFDGMTVFMPGSDHEEFVDRYMELSDEVTASKDSHGDTHKGDGSDSESMGNENDGDGSDGASGGTDDGPDIGELHASVSDLSDTVSTVADTVESVKDAVETEKADEQEAAAMIAEQYEAFSAGDVLDVIEAAAGKELGDVLDALDSVGKEDGDMEGEEDDEYEDKTEGETDAAETTEKRVDDANLGKGGSARQTAAKAHDQSGDSAGLSYRALAEQEE